MFGATCDNTKIRMKLIRFKVSKRIHMWSGYSRLLGVWYKNNKKKTLSWNGKLKKLNERANWTQPRRTTIWRKLNEIESSQQRSNARFLYSCACVCSLDARVPTQHFSYRTYIAMGVALNGAAVFKTYERISSVSVWPCVSLCYPAIYSRTLERNSWIRIFLSRTFRTVPTSIHRSRSAVWRA